MEEMAPHGRRRAPGVAQELFESGHRFDFFQAMRLLRLLRPKEPVRLRASVDMAFPASDIVQVKPPARPGGAPEMTVAFLGLGGVQGPLPRPFAQQLRDRTRVGDTGLRDFLDIFHHRLLSLLYQGRVRRRVWLEPGVPEAHDVARYLYALLGLGTRGTRGRLEVEDRLLLRYAGLLAHRPVSLEALRAMLSDALGVAVRPRAPRGAWMELEEEQRTRLGPTGRNQRLGQGAVLGGRAWLEQAGVELELGPLGWRRYVDLLPGGRGLGTLRSLTRFALGPGPEVRLVLAVRTAELPEQPLGAPSGPRLGWTSWLRARPGQRGTQAVALSPRHMSAPGAREDGT
ncbi:type VI secretion system protein ImpH [Archangium gephyra]|uniref:Type VI secretion system protein ImpH n=2 Tax=Archangium gephyra TaxID=48 RepID=A0ABX9JX92_9BACT|nr:type VI secretion system baseplate subunit TssG [Archangium gephyra]REG28835.1 type VI secretion system protein ImpH [Archangium gephyra]